MFIYIYIFGTPGRFRTFNSSLLRRVRLPLAPPGYNGVPYQYRSGTTAFTEQGAGHYTKDTIDWYRQKESNLYSHVRSVVYYPLYYSDKIWQAH